MNDLTNAAIRADAVNNNLSANDGDILTPTEEEMEMERQLALRTIGSLEKIFDQIKQQLFSDKITRLEEAMNSVRLHRDPHVLRRIVFAKERSLGHLQAAEYRRNLSLAALQRFRDALYKVLKRQAQVEIQQTQFRKTRCNPTTTIANNNRNLTTIRTTSTTTDHSPPIKRAKKKVSIATSEIELNKEPSSRTFLNSSLNLHPNQPDSSRLFIPNPPAIRHSLLPIRGLSLIAASKQNKLSVRLPFSDVSVSPAQAASDVGHMNPWKFSEKQLKALVQTCYVSAAASKRSPIPSHSSENAPSPVDIACGAVRSSEVESSSDTYLTDNLSTSPHLTSSSDSSGPPHSFSRPDIAVNPLRPIHAQLPSPFLVRRIRHSKHSRGTTNCPGRPKALSRPSSEGLPSNSAKTLASPLTIIPSDSNCQPKDRELIESDK